MERGRSELLDFLRTQSASDLVRRSAPGKWSAIDVVEHLVLSEYFIQRSVARALRNRDRADYIKLRDRVRGALLRAALIAPLRFKVPEASRAVMPTGRTDLEVLNQRWIDVRRRLGELVESLPDAGMPIAVFRHPVAGPLHLDDTLSFMEAHFAHHERQIRRVLVSPDHAPL